MVMLHASTLNFWIYKPFYNWSAPHCRFRLDLLTRPRPAAPPLEVLSNPTKRQTYDDQRRAVKRKKQGFGPPPPSGVGATRWGDTVFGRQTTWGHLTVCLLVGL